jgi:hypothetical protein
MKSIARVVLAALAVGSLSALWASPAAADCGIATTHFCAYRHRDFGDRLLHSGAPLGTDEVDIIDDVTSSAKNGTRNHWCGMTNRVLSPPALVYDFAPNTTVPYVGDDDNDRIDWFKVRTGC